MATTASQVAITPVKMVGVTYDTLGIMGLGYTVKGSKTRVNIQVLDGVFTFPSDTDVFTFIYAIGDGSKGMQNMNDTLKKAMNLSGATLPATISYADLFTLALTDANANSDFKFSLAAV